MSDDLTRLTDEERDALAEISEVGFQSSDDHWRFSMRDDRLYAAVESILAARTAALIDRLEGTREYHTGDCMDAWMLPCRCGGDTRRAERAERERDEARQAHAELMQVAGEKYEALRERARVAASELGAKNGRLAAELAALRAAVTGLADEWEAKHHTSPSRARGSGPTMTFAGAANQLRALLTDEGDNQ